MTDIPEVTLPPINGKLIKVGLVSEDYEIGGNRKGRQVVNIYDGRFTRYIAEMAKNRVIRKFDCPILIAGPRRTGKSTTAVAVAREINPNFSADCIAFRLDDFIDILNRLPPSDPDKNVYSVAILDESGVDLYSKDWQLKLTKSMVKIFQIIGMKRLIMILCLPHRNLLTKDIRESMFLWIVTQEDTAGERGFAELREGVYNKWELNLYWKPICGFCYDEQDDVFWHSYEQRKSKFIDDFVKEQKDTEPSARQQRLTKQRDEAIKVAYATTGLTQEELGKRLGLDTASINQIVNEKRSQKKKDRN